MGGALLFLDGAIEVRYERRGMSGAWEFCAKELGNFMQRSLGIGVVLDLDLLLERF